MRKSRSAVTSVWGSWRTLGPRCPPPPGLPRLPPCPAFPPSQASWPHLLLAAACAPISYSHLGRHGNKGGFQQSSRQDLPQEVCKAAPERARRPCWQPVEEDTLCTSMSSSPAPPPDHPIPVASVLSPGRMTNSVSIHSLTSLSALQPPEHFLTLDHLSPRPRAHSPSTSCTPDSEVHPPTPTASSDPQSAGSIPIFPRCDSTAVPVATISQSSSPHTPWSASPSPAVSSLGDSSRCTSALSWWQLAGRAQSLPTSTHFKGQQEHMSHHPPEASFWGVPTHIQVETGTPTFLTTDVQKTLEAWITKRAELKNGKERNKKERSDYPLNSLENTKKSPGDEDLGSLHLFWRMTDTPEQPLSPERPLLPETSGDPCQKCSQLFCGLPFPHSNPLVAAVRETPPEFPSVTLNEACHATPFQIQDKVTSHLTLAQSLSQPVTQPQLLTPTMPQIHTPPLSQIQTKTRLTPSFSIQPPSRSAPQIMTSGVTCPTSQNKAPSFIPIGMENLECQVLKKQPEEGRSLPFLVEKTQEVISQLTPNHPLDNGASHMQASVSLVPDDLLTPEHREPIKQHLLQRVTPSQPSAFTRECSQDTEKIKLRCQARIPPIMDLAKHVGHSVERTLCDLWSVSARCPVQAQGANCKESERNSVSPSTRDPHKNYPEKVLRVHLDRKLGQFHEGQIPMDGHGSRLAANQALGLLGGSNAHREARKPASSKGWEPSLNTSHKFSVSSTRSRQLPEAHIGRAQGRHWKSLPLKLRKPRELFKLEKARRSPFQRSPIICSATCASRALSKARVAAFFGKPPRPHSGGNLMTEDTGPNPQPVPGDRVITDESGSTPEGDLHTVSIPAFEEIQRSLGRTPHGDGCGLSEAPLVMQEDRPPSQNVIYPFVGRIWHSNSVVGAKKDSSELSPRAVVAKKVPFDETVAQTSQGSCQSITILELKSESQSSRAEEAREVVESLDASAWEAILGPCVLASPRESHVDLRRSGSAGSSKSSSLPMQSDGQDPEEPPLDAHLTESELGELGESDNQTQGGAASVLLEDCETGVILQDCATHTLMRDCHSDVFLAADMLACQASLFDSHSVSTGDLSASHVLHDITSSEGSSQGESLGLQDQHKSQGEMSVPTVEREDSRSPSPGQQGLAGLRTSGAIRMSIGQDKQSAKCLTSKSFQLTENRQASPEDLFKKKNKHLLQCVCPRNGKGPERTLQKGQPSAATAQRWEPAQSSSVLKSRAAEAQALLKTVGRILEENITVHHERSASGFTWCKGECHAPAGPQVCSHRVLSYTEQRKLLSLRSASHAQGPSQSAQEHVGHRQKQPGGLPTQGASVARTLPAWAERGRALRQPPPLSKAVAHSNMCPLCSTRV